MLYLVRKLEEAIIINNDIEIKIVEVKRNAVKLGITFPKTSTVLRKEVHDMIAQENMSALWINDLEAVSFNMANPTLEDDESETRPITNKTYEQKPHNS